MLIAERWTFTIKCELWSWSKRYDSACYNNKHIKRLMISIIQLLNIVPQFYPSSLTFSGASARWNFVKHFDSNKNIFAVVEILFSIMTLMIIEIESKLFRVSFAIWFWTTVKNLQHQRNEWEINVHARSKFVVLYKSLVWLSDYFRKELSLLWRLVANMH